MKRKSDCTPKRKREYRKGTEKPVKRDPIYDPRRDGGADDRDATARWMGDPPAWRRAVSQRLEGANG